MKPTRLVIAAAVTVLALPGAANAAVSAPRAATVANTCGGAFADYTGLLALDAPFIGTVTLPGGGTRDITLTPQVFNSNLLKTEITASPTDSRYAVGPFTLRVNSLGRGTMTFPTFAGEYGETLSVVCPVGTRVTKMAGKVMTAGVSGVLDFTASRT